jgi:dolichyl-phosphate beta-glucosyltransferase
VYTTEIKVRNVTETSNFSRCIIVVPCYNEARRLLRDRFLEYLDQQRSIDFLFVNDGSTDGTGSLLESMRLGHEDRIFVLDKKNNAGKGEAVRDGMLAAVEHFREASSFVGFWDADLATPLTEIPDLLQEMRDDPHWQMVFGSRVRLLGRNIHRKMTRHYLGRLFATAASLVLSLPIYDTQCGAKIFRVTPDLKRVLAEPFTSRWIFDVEIVARFIQLRGQAFCFSSIREFPVESWEDVSGSRVRPLDFFRSAFDLLRIHHRYLSNRHNKYRR